MSRSKGIVFAFGAPREPAQASGLSQGSNPFAPTGPALVRVGLMADIPNDAVRRRVEHIVQRGRPYDDAEAGVEMTACLRDSTDRFGAQFVGELSEIILFQLA